MNNAMSCFVTHSAGGISVYSPCGMRTGGAGCPHEHGGYDPFYIKDFHELMRHLNIRHKGTLGGRSRILILPISRDQSIQHYTHTRPALPVEQEMTQTAAVQTGTTVTARLSHLFYVLLRRVWDESGDPPIRPVMNAIFSVDTIYDLCLAQPNKKKQGARGAPNLCLNI